jgi:peptidoglycan hydrolase CwlO-like protein
MNDLTLILVGALVVIVIALLVRGAKTRRRLDAMATILEDLQSANDDADAAIARVQEDVDALRAKIDELENAPRELSAEEKAKLGELKDKLNALDPTNPNTLKAGHGKKKKS